MAKKESNEVKLAKIHNQERARGQHEGKLSLDRALSGTGLSRGSLRDEETLELRSLSKEKSDLQWLIENRDMDPVQRRQLIMATRGRITDIQKRGEEANSIRRLQSEPTAAQIDQRRDDLVGQVGPARQANAQQSAANLADTQRRVQASNQQQAAQLGAQLHPDIAGVASQSGLATIGRDEAPFSRGGQAMSEAEVRRRIKVKEAERLHAENQARATPEAIAASEGRLEAGFQPAQTLTRRGPEGEITFTPDELATIEKIKVRQEERRRAEQAQRDMQRAATDAEIASINAVQAQAEQATRQAQTGGAPGVASPEVVEQVGAKGSQNVEAINKSFDMAGRLSRDADLSKLNQSVVDLENVLFDIEDIAEADPKEASRLAKQTLSLMTRVPDSIPETGELFAPIPVLERAFRMASAGLGGAMATETTKMFRDPELLKAKDRMARDVANRAIGLRSRLAEIANPGTVRP